MRSKNQNQTLQKDKFLSGVRQSSISNVVTYQRVMADQDSLEELLQGIDEQLSSPWQPSFLDNTSEEHGQDLSCFEQKILVETSSSKTNNTQYLDDITQIFEKSTSLNTTPIKKPLSFQSDSLSLSQEFVPPPRYLNQCHFEIKPEQILFDPRTTVMIRNIPNKYTQQLLMSEIEEHFKNKVDFFYLPIDFKSGCNVGYAFANFVDRRDMVEFHRIFNGSRWKKFNSEKICELRYARVQGRTALTNHFNNNQQIKLDCHPRQCYQFLAPQQASKIETLIKRQKVEF